MKHLFITALLTVMSTTAAHASLIRWTLPETFFDIGNDASFGFSGSGFGGPCPTPGTCGSVQGFFDIDTDTGDPVDWLFTVAGGDTATFAESTYTPLNSFDFDTSTALQLQRTDVVATPPLVLRVAGFGSSAFLTPGSATLSTLVECFNCSTFRDVSNPPTIQGVAVQDVAVPLPAGLSLLLAGMGALVWQRRRRAA